jgi:uncharacterized protein
MDQAGVVNNEAEGRFELHIDGKMAFLAYRRAAREIAFTHAEVPPEWEGRGIGGQVVHAGLEFARERPGSGSRVPVCSLVHPPASGIRRSGAP